MKITKVTMTGADDSIKDPQLLIDISHKYPFVEWGILVSGKQFGNNRFPSIEWINKLMGVAEWTTNLSCHLCGQYVKDILQGKAFYNDGIGWPVSLFDRFQINTRGQKHKFNIDGINCLRMLGNESQIIFQNDNANVQLMEYAREHGVNCSTLFDLSHGAGALPPKWPKPLNYILCGYAGGLGPDNIKNQLDLIAEAAGDDNIWIDMETRIRSDDDQRFDLDKVVAVLEIVKNSGYLIESFTTV